MSRFENYEGYRIEIVKDVVGPKMLKDWSETEYETMRARVVVNPTIKKRTYAAQVLRDKKWLTLCGRDTNKTLRFKDVFTAEAAAMHDMRTLRDIAHGDWD